MRAYQWVLNLVDKASGPMQQILQKAEKMSGVFDKAKAGAKSLAVGMMLANQAAQGISTAANTLNSAIEPGVKFQQSLADLSALTGQTGKDLQSLGMQGRDMSLMLGGSAADNIESYKGILGELGPQMATNKAAMASMGASVGILAKSMKGDSVGSMKALTTSLQQFNVDLKNPVTAAKAMTTAMNVMAAGANAGAAEVPDIAAAIRVAGVAASGARVSFIETNAAIQVLAQGGLKGAEAGTALRNVLGKLGEGRFLPKEVQTELKAAGVNIATLGDKSKSFAARLTELKKIQGDSALVTKLFGTENSNAANILLRGTGAMLTYQTAITGTNAATDAARIIMDTHAGRMDRAKALWENLGISVFQATEPYLGFIQGSAKAAVMVSQMIPLLQMVGTGFMAVVPAIWKFVFAQTASGLSMLKNLGLMVSTGVLGLISFSGSLLGATVAQWALNAAMSANPIGLVVAGLALVAGAVWAIMANWDVLKGWMWNLTQTLLKLSPFYWLVKGAFELFPSLEKWFTGLWDRVTSFAKSLVGKFKGLWDTIAPYLGLGTMKVGNIDAKLMVAGPKEDPFATAGGKAQAIGAGGKAVKMKADKVASGGSKPTTVNITIGKFQDSVNFYTQNMTENANDAVKLFEEALERVINGVSQGVGIA
jgi:TP901 family phage tail tape measure protein